MSELPALRDGEQRVFFQAGGEWCYLWTPAAFRQDQPIAVVIHHHGATGYVRADSADWLEEGFKTAFLRAVMEAVPGGCAIAGSHACGDHWGNDCALAANLALYNTLAQSPHIDAGRIGLMGGGLGGALIWNTVARLLSQPTPHRPIRAVAVMQAIASLESMIRAGKFKANCLGGHNLPADMATDDAVARIAPFDPLPKLRNLSSATVGASSIQPSRLPAVAIYHGAEDENVLPEGNAIPLAQTLEMLGADVTLELFPGVGHATYELGKPLEDRLAAFFRATLQPT